MAFTYVGDLSTSLDKVRFHIGDTVEDAGPKPSDGNFTDAELSGLVTSEGSWQRAVAAAYETLDTLWTKHVSFNADGMSANLSDVAAGYRAQALHWRDLYGYTNTGKSGSSAPTRKDGYSTDIPSDRVNGT